MKEKYPRADAVAVAKELCDALKPHCERLIVAGSLRRGRLEVGDVEILYVPKMGETKKETDDLFAGPAVVPVNHADDMIETFIASNRLKHRENVKGSTTWGPKNKLAVHVASGIPVDLFAATHENWWNYLVCRTGGAQNNVAICNAAIYRGWKWNPYGSGFSRQSGLGEQSHVVGSEREVFEFVGLPFLEPHQRK